MLSFVILGLGSLVAIIMLVRWYANAEIADLKRLLKLIAIFLLGLAILFLAITGRFAAALGMVMGALALGWKFLNFFGTLQKLLSLLGLLGGLGWRSGAKTPGKTSQVDSNFLRMNLDHDTGKMDGEVLYGQFQGRVLSGMNLKDLLALRSAVDSDPDSKGLIEAYLDRTHAGWREEASPGSYYSDGASSSSSGPSGPMNRDEAYRVLSLSPGASRREIKRAYRQLMAKVHPDKGGSAYLASKINEAKDLLLSD
ncbi:MAG: DnaJ domain-containing protein [Rhodospirillaceae bacterium]